MSLGLRPTSIPSGVVNDPSNHLATIHEHYRQDNGRVAYGEPLLVTVAPKLNITFGDLMFALFFVVINIVTVGVTQSLVSLQFGDDV